MMATRYANNQSITINCNGTTTTNKIIINGGQFFVPEFSPVGSSETSPKQTVDSSIYWTREEQSLLEELIVKYASDSMVMRYAKIAVKLQDKTLEDVAIRYRWMIEKKKRKQRKTMEEKEIKEETSYQQVNPSSTNHSSDECIDEEISYKVTISGVAAQLLEQNDQTINHISANGHAFKENGKRINDCSNSSRKRKDKKGKASYQQVNASSDATNHCNGNHDADCEEDIDDEISYKAIGGAAARLLEQNDQAIDHILANVSAYKLHENILLESQTRNNINALLYESLYNTPEMKPSARQLYDYQVLRRVKRKLNFPLD